MLRSAVLSAVSASRSVRSAGVAATRAMSHGPKESDEAFDERYIKFFSRPDADGWDIRKAMNDLAGMDLVPEPKVIEAALRACRRVNDYALAVRILETVKDKAKCDAAIYPYLLQELKPTLDELGVDTPEALGYDKPELALSSVFDIH